MASHTRSLNDCSKEGAPFEGDAYFKLSYRDGALSYQACASAEDCSSAEQNRGFSRHTDATWVGVRTDAEKLRGVCNAQLAERIASRINGDNIQIEERHFRGEFAREDGQECPEALVLSNRAELACHQRDIIKATPVEQP